MSRSYHTTRKAVARRVRNGEPEAVQELKEKNAVKFAISRWRADYPAACPSAKDTKLKNSFVVGVAKRVLKPRPKEKAQG